MQNAKIFKKKSRKGQSALPYTVTLVLFNAFIYILVGSFASDPLASDIGRSGFGSIDINESDSSDTELTISETSSFISRFFLVFFDLPWWVLVFVTMVNGVLIPLIILSWIRGV